MNLSNINRTGSRLTKWGTLHFFLVLACMVMQLFDVSQLYRFFTYLNIAVVLFLLPKTLNWHDVEDRRRFYLLILLPMCFVLLHFFAMAEFEVNKEIRRIFSASFLGIGIWLLAKNNANLVKAWTERIILFTIFAYVLVQSIAFWALKMEFAVFDNPHYLAFYSATLLIIASYYFVKTRAFIKYLLLLSIGLLGYFTLISQSRPTWIGLMIAVAVLIIFLDRQMKIRVFLAFVTLLSTLILFDVGNFATRFQALLSQLGTEERVTIWHDHWQMQMSSTIKEWILGHGLSLSRYEDAFKAYSKFHLEHLDYNMPHNFILEILYASGVVGLCLAAILLIKIYQYLIKGIRASDANHSIYLLMLLVFTANLVTVSITVPFTSVYNINMIAFIVGIMLFLNEGQLTYGARDFFSASIKAK